MKALRFHETGEAAQVLQLVDVPEPAAPNDGEVVVDVLYSPVNFHDLLFISGHLFPPTLPAVPGNEGIGRIRAVGQGVSNVSVGDVVVFPLLQGAWREAVALPAAGLAALPDGHLEQFSMLGSNTPTAGLALSEFVAMEPGAWIAQSSANGGVGRNVIALAKKRGLKTVNLVRREEAVEELRASGADVVLVDGPDAAEQIREQTSGAPIALAIDGVGGQAASHLLQALESGGTLVSYNKSSGQDVDAELASSKDIEIKGIFVGSFDYASKVAPIIAEAIPLVESGELDVPVAKVYKLEEFRAAIQHLKNGGKVLFKVGD